MPLPVCPVIHRPHPIRLRDRKRVRSPQHDILFNSYDNENQFLSDGPILPTWNHIHKSRSNSSRREQAANVAMFSKTKTLSATQNKRYDRRAKRKAKKQETFLDIVSSPPDNTQTALISVDDVNREIIVFDGSINTQQRIQPPPKVRNEISPSHCQYTQHVLVIIPHISYYYL